VAFGAIRLSPTLERRNQSSPTISAVATAIPAAQVEAPSWVVQDTHYSPLFSIWTVPEWATVGSHFHQGRHAPRPTCGRALCPAALPSPCLIPPASAAGRNCQRVAKILLGPGQSGACRVRSDTPTGDVTDARTGPLLDGSPWLFRLLLRLLQQRRHVGPQPLAGGAFLRGQFRQGRLIADAGEVFVLLPVAQASSAPRRGRRWAAIQLLGVKGQVGAEPIEGLLPQPGLLLCVEFSSILALAGSGQGGSAGGGVAVLNLQSGCCGYFESSASFGSAAKTAAYRPAAVWCNFFSSHQSIMARRSSLVAGL